MKTLSEGDEPILQNILDKVIFKQVENVEEEHLQTLRAFGFCITPDYENKDSASKETLYHVKVEGQESMLPLRDDWLIRPIFYITSPEQKL